MIIGEMKLKDQYLNSPQDYWNEIIVNKVTPDDNITFGSSNYVVYQESLEDIWRPLKNRYLIISTNDLKKPEMEMLHSFTIYNPDSASKQTYIYIYSNNQIIGSTYLYTGGNKTVAVMLSRRLNLENAESKNIKVVLRTNNGTLKLIRVVRWVTPTIGISRKIFDNIGFIDPLKFVAQAYIVQDDKQIFYDITGAENASFTTITSYYYRVGSSTSFRVRAYQPSPQGDSQYLRGSFYLVNAGINADSRKNEIYIVLKNSGFDTSIIQQSRAYTTSMTVINGEADHIMVEAPQRIVYMRVEML